MKEALEYKDEQDPRAASWCDGSIQTYRNRGAGAASFRRFLSWTGASGGSQERLMDYFQQINRAVMEQLHDQKAPLIVSCELYVFLLQDVE